MFFMTRNKHSVAQILPLLIFQQFQWFYQLLLETVFNIITSCDTMRFISSPSPSADGAYHTSWYFFSVTLTVAFPAEQSCFQTSSKGLS